MSLPRVSVRSGWGFVGVCGCVRPHWCCGPPPATSAAPALRRASRVRVRRLELEHQHSPIHPCPRTHALNNFVEATSLSLMVARRLVWIWPQRFPTAIVWLRLGGGFELFGRVEYRVINSGALLLLGVWFNPMIAAANAVWPWPAIANTCFVLGRCLGWELTPSKAASCVYAGRDDSFPRGLHVSQICDRGGERWSRSLLVPDHRHVKRFGTFFELHGAQVSSLHCACVLGAVA